MAFRIVLDAEPARVTLAAIRAMPAAIRRDVSSVLRKEAQEVARATRKLLRRPAPRTRGRVRRSASSDGEPPLKRSGDLARSIRVKRARGGLSYTIGSKLFYAKFLETGTKTGLAPRPFLTRALEERQDRIATNVGDALRRVIRRQVLKAS